jgi:hypothetical protein
VVVGLVLSLDALKVSKKPVITVQIRIHLTTMEVMFTVFVIAVITGGIAVTMKAMYGEAFITYTPL